MVVVGSYRYDIVADTSKFTAGMVATRRELSAARKLFQATRTPIEALEASIEGLGHAYRKGVIDQQTYTRAMQQLRSKMDAAKAPFAQLVKPIQSVRSELGLLAKGYIAFQGAMVARRAMGTTLGLVGRGFGLAADQELAEADFAALTGSDARGALLAQQLNQYATSTTLETGAVMSQAQRLLAFGIEVDKIIPSLKVLGDIAGGDSERMKGLALAFGQATSLGRLQREEVNQMVERGFNPMNYIVKITGESMEELSARMQRGEVAASELWAAMELATSKGERFFDRVNAKAKTFRGQLELMKDDFDLILRDLASFGIEPGKQAVGGVRGILQGIRSNPGAIVDQGLGTLFGLFGGDKAQATYRVASNLFGVSDIASQQIRGASLNKQVDVVARANAEEMAKVQEKASRRGTGNAFGIGAGVAGSLLQSVKGAASLLGATARNAQPGLAQAGLDIWNRSQRQALLMEQARKLAEEEYKVSQPAAAAARGSREEFQLRSQMQRENEARKRHQERQSKLEEIRQAIINLRMEQQQMTLVPGN